MCKSARACLTTCTCIYTSCWASRPAILPELSQFLRKLLAGRRPVVTDTIAKFGNMTLQVQLVLFEPGYIEFLTRRSAFELTCNVFLVIANDPFTTSMLVL